MRGLSRRLRGLGARCKRQRQGKGWYRNKDHIKTEGVMKAITETWVNGAKVEVNDRVKNSDRNKDIDESLSRTEW